MPWFRNRDEDEDEVRRPPDKSVASKAAWLVLAGGAALVGLRACVATVVTVHGNGMAPTVLDGDSVMLMRGTWRVQPGDLVIYDPTFEFIDPETVVASPEDVPNGQDGRDAHFVDTEKREAGELRNTAVVDMEQLEGNWRRVQRTAGNTKDTHRVQDGLRVGRVIARPGDSLRFDDPEGALGLAINDVPLGQKPSEPLRLRLGPEQEAQIHLRSAAYESVGNVSYQVLASTVPSASDFEVLRRGRHTLTVPDDAFVVLADNRDEGACCDSRAIGFVPAKAIKGEVVARLTGDPSATPDLDPDSRGLRWLP